MSATWGAARRRAHDIVLMTLLTTALGTASLRAYTLLPVGAGFSNVTRYTFYLDDDLVWNMTWNASGLGATNSKILNQLDRVMQQWSQFPRAKISVKIASGAIAIAAPACSLTGIEDPVGSGWWTGLCGVVGPFWAPRNEIVHGTPPWWLPAGTLGLASCYSTGHCDIFIPDGTAFSLLEDSVNANGATSGTVNWARNIGHEVGHTFGISHPTPQNNNCGAGLESPLMCQTGAGMAWDHPAHDDSAAARARHGASNASLTMVRTALTATGGMAWSTQSLTGIPAGPSGATTSFLARPRISCGPNGNMPDCVFVSTGDDCGGGGGSCIKLLAASQIGTAWAVGSSTSWNTTSSLQEPDVAYGGSTNGAVAVWATKTTRAATFGRWSLTNGGLPTSGSLQNSLGTLISHGSPRVGWHEGIDRYVAAVVDRTRRIWIATSSNVQGTSWQQAQLLRFSDGVSKHPAGLFDLACPTHYADPSTLNQYSTCTLIMNEQSSDQNTNGPEAGLPSGAQQEPFLANQMTVCRFLVTFNAGTGLYVAGNAVCNTAGWADTMQVGLWEARFGPAPETPAWVSSVSRAFPIANDNTAQILATSSDFLTGPSPAIFNIPFGGGVDSDWGGLSCDFVEFNKTMVCPQLLFGGDPW